MFSPFVTVLQCLRAQGSRLRRLCLPLLLLLPLCAMHAAVYQYTAVAGTQRAYLWLPPEAPQIRGLIVSMQNMLELNWLEDPLIRQTAAEEGLGILYISGRDAAITWEMKPGSTEALAQLCRDFAAQSGYGELAHAPFLWIGHSFHGRTWLMAAAMPERTIAAIPIRTYPMPESLPFTGIPIVYVVGQTTELPQYSDGRPGDRDFFWPVVRATSLALRAANRNHLIGVVVEPGGTHTDWTERQARFVSLIIHKACHYRLPANPPRQGPVTLKPIAADDGWLTDSGLLEPDRFSPASVREYRGDPEKAYWFFDRETAEAAAAFNGDRVVRRKQMVTFRQDGKRVPVERNGSVRLRFEPEADGRTFRVEGDWLDRVPEGLADAGAPLGHAEGPFHFFRLLGPCEQLGPDRFRVHFDRHGVRGIMLNVEHPGDATYRRAVQPGTMPLPTQLTEGKRQTVTFPALGDHRVAEKVISLGATTDSGLPVEYYVVAGPVEVDGDALRITDVPVRAKYPIQVTVVAMQWGRTIPPLFQTAAPVEQSFFLTR